MEASEIEKRLFGNKISSEASDAAWAKVEAGRKEVAQCWTYPPQPKAAVDGGMVDASQPADEAAGPADEARRGVTTALHISLLAVTTAYMISLCSL